MLGLVPPSLGVRGLRLTYATQQIKLDAVLRKICSLITVLIYSPTELAASSEECSSSACFSLSLRRFLA